MIYLEPGIDGETLKRLGPKRANAEARRRREERVELEIDRFLRSGRIEPGQTWKVRVGRKPFLGSDRIDSVRIYEIRVARVDAYNVFFKSKCHNRWRIYRMSKRDLRRDWRMEQ